MDRVIVFLANEGMMKVCSGKGLMDARKKTKSLCTASNCKIQKPCRATGLVEPEVVIGYNTSLFILLHLRCFLKRNMNYYFEIFNFVIGGYLTKLAASASQYCNQRTFKFHSIGLFKIGLRIQI